MVLKDIIVAMTIREPVPVKTNNLKDFFSRLHQHLKDVDYKVNCRLAFGGQILTAAHCNVYYKLFLAFRKNLSSKKSDILFPISERELTNRQINDSCKFRIRYVGEKVLTPCEATRD